MRELSVLLLLLWFMPTVSAESSQCIQHPKRTKACPHSVYRVAQFTQMSSPALICICVSDFEVLLTPPIGESEQVRWNMTKRQMEVIYGSKLQAILDILQRKS